jgi:hypothetical protein
MNLNLDYVALLVASLAYFGMGALTYSPLLFGRAWMRLSGLSAQDVAAAPKFGSYAFTFVCALLNVFVLAEVLDYVQTTSLRGAWGVAILLWFGIYVAARAPEAIFGRQSWKLVLINACYPLLGTLVASTILTLWPGPA